MKCQDDLYRKGYLAGYRDGLKDASNGRTLQMVESDISNLPIQAMNLSSRAYNCLIRAKCEYIGDVISLSENKILTTRTLGAKTASEIADWLDRNGIRYSAWSKYL